MEKVGIKWESKSLLDLDYNDDLNAVAKNVSKMTNFERNHFY